MSVPLEITCQALQQLREAGGALSLIDCRTPREWAICRLDGSHFISMQEIPDQLEVLRALPEPRVVVCHAGVRSLRVVQWLAAQEVAALSLCGGLDAWAQEVDPAMPRY